jgi:hypothetical protein
LVNTAIAFIIKGRDIPGALLTSMTFGKGGEDGVSQGELGQILSNIILVLIRLEAV